MRKNSEFSCENGENWEKFSIFKEKSIFFDIFLKVGTIFA